MVSNVDTTWFPGGHYMVSTWTLNPKSCDLNGN